MIKKFILTLCLTLVINIASSFTTDPIKEEVKPTGIAKLTYREALLKNITKK